MAEIGVAAEMRIVFLAVDDEFAGSMQRYAYERLPGRVVGSVISTRAIYKKSNFGAMVFVIKRSGLWYGAEMFRMKVLRRIFHTATLVRPSELARKYNVETFYSKNINDETDIARLKSWSPDLIISTNFSHYVGNRVREIARVGTWNVHKSYLPYYRGMAPNFYALLNGEKRVGVTLHQIVKGFDAGDIIRQLEIPVAPHDSVYSLNQKTSDAGGRMLAQVLEEAELQTPVATPQPGGNWPNYSYPTRAHIRTFRGKGLRF
jgi:folate-dependent phosphoribosylglycinamide formyltransferase PurN